VLRSQGFDSIVATNGVDGLQAYRERHEEICLVLSDISMPRMDGVELARNLFNMHSHANIILMSGAHLCNLVPDEVRKLCSVLEKPFTPGHLLLAVKKCLKYDDEHNPAAVSNSR
jgi:DNA-binding NtrC family response regulator